MFALNRQAVYFAYSLLLINTKNLFLRVIPPLEDLCCV